MNSSVICTFVGRDKPGLVESLAKAVDACHGSWLESSSAQLAGQFAGIVRIAIDETHLATLQQRIAALQSKELQLQLRDGESGQIASPSGSPLQLTAVGNDRPGIVHEISQALAAAGLNVIKMDTSLSSAAMSGDTLFHSRMLLSKPDGGDIDALESQLDSIAERLTIEIDLDDER